MRFHTIQDQFYCGIKLHARLLGVRIVNQAGNETGPRIICDT